jgi:ubiquitin carboxyl-terminal hydrolase L3
MSPTERGATLEKVEELNEAHRETANEGQTAAPAVTANTSLHFVALVHRGGRLWELDGTRSGLVDHGPSSEQSFLEDAAAVCRRVLEANPDEHRFSVLAITAKSAQDN